jgi:hypothetical protein
MLLESRIKAMARTSITLNRLVRVALIRGLISEWSVPQQIEALQETLTEVLRAKQASEKERNEPPTHRTD